MPRTTTAGSSAFTQVQTQARELLAKLRSEIRTKDAELRRLRQEESKLAALTGQPGMAASNGGMATRRGARGREHVSGRYSWEQTARRLEQIIRASQGDVINVVNATADPACARN